MAAAAALTFLARSRLVLHLAFAALLCFGLGMFFAKLETMRAGTKVLGGEISTRLTGRVAVIEHQANGRIRMTIDVIATERPTLKYVPQRVRVSSRAIPDGLKAGDVVTGARTARPAIRADQAGRLRLFLQQLFRRHRRQRLFPEGTRRWRHASRR